MRRATLALSLLLFSFASLIHGQPTPTITSVLDPYTDSSMLSPGGLAVIKGSALGTIPQVTVGGKAAYTLIQPYQAGGNRMTIEIPVDAPLGATNLTVGFATGVSSAPFSITLTQYAPVLISSTGGKLVSPMHQQSGLPVTASVPAAAGEAVLLTAIGLGPTNPAVATGTAAPPNTSTTVTPAVTLGVKPVTGASAGLIAGQIGLYQVSFTVPAGTPAGSYPLTVSMGGAASNSVTLFVGAAPSGPVITSLVDAVTGTTRLCPGDLATLGGLNLGANPQVTVGGKAAYTVTPPQNGSQMVIEIPVDAPGGSPSVVVTNGTGPSSLPFPIVLAASAPVLYDSTSGAATAPIHQNTGAPVTFANPALPNESIVLFGIGLGPTNPVVATGTPSPSGVQLATPPLVHLVNAVATIPGATASLVPGQVGVYQIVFTVPASPPTPNPFLWVEGTGNLSTSSNYINVPTALSTNPPAIDHLSNNYSYLLPGMPSYGIAQGSIFDIFGTNLANASTGLQSVPLSTSLGRATVDVTVNGTVTHALMLFASPSQIVAILPSATPVGDGMITVNNGLASSSATIHVVQSAFGMLTLNGVGTGPAAAFDANFSLLSFTNAINPGEYFVLWGTGVGPAPGDERVAQTAADLTNVPFSIEVGGMPAQLYYHGRSQYPGLDQVIGIVPAGVQPGCWVSVVTRSGNTVSNFATIPVAASGRVCADPVMGISASQMQALVSKNSFNLGGIVLQKAFYTQGAPPGAITITDSATAQFVSVKPAAFGSSLLGPSLGSCLVTPIAPGGGVGTSFASAKLDAGQTVHITGPSGTAGIQYQSNSALAFSMAFGSDVWPTGPLADLNSSGAYSGSIGGATPTAGLPEFISANGGGTFNFDNGNGGGDVGAFMANLTFPSPLLSWPQRKGLDRGTVSRSSGFTVTWSNGSNDGSMVQVSGLSVADGYPGVAAQFRCSAPASAGQLTIPASVLLTLPLSITNPAVNPNMVSLMQVAQFSPSQPFPVPNLDFTSLQTMVAITIVVYYQ